MMSYDVYANFLEVFLVESLKCNKFAKNVTLFNFQEEQEKSKVRNEKIRKIREGLQKSSLWSQYFKNLEFEEGNFRGVSVKESVICSWMSHALKIAYTICFDHTNDATFKDSMNFECMKGITFLLFLTHFSCIQNFHLYHNKTS